MTVFRNSRSPRLVVGVGILFLILLFSVLLYFQLTKEEKSTSFSSTASINEKTRRVFIKDLQALNTPSDDGIKRLIENSLYAYSINNNGGVPDLFTGIIRTNSLSNSTNGITTFLVDVEPIKMTFLVTANDTLGDDSYVNVECATDSQQMLRNTTCTNLDGIK